MYSTVVSASILGVDAVLIQVEIDVARGLPMISMVGNLSSQVKEAKERVWAALKNMELEIPPMHITVSLSPGDIRKEGTGFDLPIAVGMLQALEYFPKEATENTLFIGEIGLNGELRPVSGILPIVELARKQHIKTCIVPAGNGVEGALIPEIDVCEAQNLEQVIAYLSRDREEDCSYEPLKHVTVDIMDMFYNGQTSGDALDFANIHGQYMAKRATEIAVAGFHNMLMVGPPGAGKSMIAKRIPYILPPMTMEECLEVTAIASVTGQLSEQTLQTKRPFLSPHHTITQSALIGGGKIPKPGMISMAHRGVLFLDEMPEFQRASLDALRQPLEDKSVHIVRVGGNYKYPCDFMLVAAMNPCPCGYYPDRNKCRCTAAQVAAYMGKISGPVLDRIDLGVQLQAVGIHDLQAGREEESSQRIRARVEQARQKQLKRFENTPYRFNSEIEAKDIGVYCALDQSGKESMEKIYAQFQLSARSYHRILRVARTIADLEGTECIRKEHLLEAAGYRIIYG